ncbi:endonuclease/exonuclease/phosphatase family protein [Amantichitinum ursilacus]|uniref:Endonuclease/Exonuclease/phosphatase family protein n=1 Tax=Amantichitinum ursilacus TaxID=857265 RepID=A0A0N0GQI4_9NEIS|nr:endonuclease/exonuclease/phosphatase family protein [Amantichitinum ursilacus]KPC54723.1 Endonuclease/Exonuclease/phosphatase family protein [Amantichitinum ursilacus]
MNVKAEQLEMNLAEGSASSSPWPLTIATYNIHGAVGSDRRRSAQRVAAVLRQIDADVVALQEVPMGDEHIPDILSAITDLTGYQAVAGPTIDHQHRRYGNAVLTRHPIRAVRNVDLSFGSSEPRGALDADIECHGHLLRVVATHLGLRPAERRNQVKRLLETFDTDTMPVVLLGDLNEWFVWGRPLRWLTTRFQKTPSPLTFPSLRPVFALDRIWLHPRERLVRVWAHNTRLARQASDHLPLVAHIGR